MEAENTQPRPRGNRFRFLPLLIVLVAVDLVSKLAAYYVFPGAGSGTTGIRYAVQLNDTGSNAAIDYYKIGSDLTILLASFVIGLMGVYVIVSRHLKLRTSYKIVFGIALYAVFSIILGALPESHTFIVRNRGLMGVLKLLGALFFYGTLFYYTESADFKLGWTLMLSGGLGNFLSFLYPPFSVIDFIVVPLPGVGDTVCNLADVFSTVSVIYVVVLSIVRLVKYVIDRRKQAASAR